MYCSAPLEVRFTHIWRHQRRLQCRHHSDAIKALLCSALQGVSLTTLRHQSRRFRRRVSGVLMGRVAATASDAVPGGRFKRTGARFRRAGARFRRAGARFRRAAGALFRRASGSLVVRWWRALQVRLQALSPAKGTVGLHCRLCEAPSPRVVRAR